MVTFFSAVPRPGRPVARFAPALVLVLAAGLPGCAATAMSSVGEAEVTTAQGQPCFSPRRVLPDGDAPFRVHSLSVAPEEGGSGDWRHPPEAWAFIAPWPGLLRDGSSCIRYGSLPAAAQSHGDATPLQAGHVYQVTISAGRADGSGPAIGYRARFCVAATSGSTLEARTVTWDEKERRWRPDACASR